MMLHDNTNLELKNREESTKEPQNAAMSHDIPVNFELFKIEEDSEEENE